MSHDQDHIRIAIIGSGFAGLGMAIRLKQQGIEDFAILERAEDVGGTWRDNTYPGCQCDVPSHLYSFSFAPNPGWTRTYSKQQEIWDYLRRCSDEHGITPHVRFGHELQHATWDEDEQLWRLDTAAGPLTADVVVAGPGPLSDPRIPDVPGLEGFEGKVFHSAQWDHDYDLRGKRVAVIGTGASAIQFVPHIQKEAGDVHVFQRTAPWVLPHTDRPTSRFERRLYELFPPLQRLVRAGIYVSRELVVLGMVYDRRLMKLLERMARRHLQKQVPDPELRERLTPNYTIGCKRILPSNRWYPALSQPNVDVISSGLAEVRGSTVIADDGSRREVDAIIFGTGFHVTDMPVGHRVTGRGGRLLDDVWQGSPQAHLGTTISGFPNLFLLVGPNTGLGHNSIVFMIEAQLAYVLDCLRKMEERGLQAVDVRPEVQDSFNARLQKQLKDTVWNAGGCASWYIDANGRNSTIWPDFTFRYRQRTRRFDPAEYVATPRLTAPEALPALSR